MIYITRISDYQDCTETGLFIIESEKPLMIDSLQETENGKIEIFLNGNASLTFYRSGGTFLKVEQTNMQLEREQPSALR